MNKYLKILVISILVLLLGWIFRIQILVSIGGFLDKSEKAQSAQRIFVLGGNGYDRGLKAAKLWHQGMAPKIICTGEYVSGTLKSLGLSHSEADLCAFRIRSLDVDSANVEAISYGTSTMEESEFILDKCLKNGWNKVILVSDIFHTRRIRNVFEQKFSEKGVQVIIVGAPSSHYNEDEWWKYEMGLIMVNNEYIKQFYYWWYY